MPDGLLVNTVQAQRSLLSLAVAQISYNLRGWGFKGLGLWGLKF